MANFAPSCGLTPRSSGAPTAGHQARSVACLIFHSPGLASHRWLPLSSNVRPRLQTSFVRVNSAREGSHRLRNSRIHRILGWLFNSNAFPSFAALRSCSASAIALSHPRHSPKTRSPTQRPRAWRARSSNQAQFCRASAPYPRPRAARPNPSLKWSANGLPPGPGRGKLHSPPPGPGGKPSSPT